MSVLKNESAETMQETGDDDPQSVFSKNAKKKGDVLL